MCGREPPGHGGDVNPISPAAGTGRTWRRPPRPLWRWAVDLILLAAAVVSVLTEPMSIAIHSVLGLIFAGFVAPHLWNRRAWIRGALRRLWQRRSLSRTLRWSLSQAAVLLVLTLIVTASGLWDWLDGRTTIRWHAISSIILLAVVLRHTWTRRGWLLRRRAARTSAASPGAALSVAATSRERGPRG